MAYRITDGSSHCGLIACAVLPLFSLLLMYGDAIWRRLHDGPGQGGGRINISDANGTAEVLARRSANYDDLQRRRDRDEEAAIKERASDAVRSASKK